MCFILNHREDITLGKAVNKISVSCSVCFRISAKVTPCYRQQVPAAKKKKIKKNNTPASTLTCNLLEHVLKQKMEDVDVNSLKGGQVQIRKHM